MSVRSLAVGALSSAAVVAGVAAVQSGIPGAAALPILPHPAVAPAGVADVPLPAPVEVGAPPPPAGTMHGAPIVRAIGRPSADRPAKRAARPDGKPDKAGKQDPSGKGPGHDADAKAGKDGGGPGRD